MSLNEAHARIKSRIWQAVAQSDLDMNTMDKATVETLVDLTTEAALLEMDEMIAASLKGEAQSAAELNAEAVVDEDVFDNNKEDILWEGRPFLSLVMHYTITDERIRLTEGLVGKARDNVELVRIQDMSYSQTVTERMLNLGDVTIRSHDSSRPTIVLRNVQEPEKVYEILRRAVLNARKKHGFTYREEM